MDHMIMQGPWLGNLIIVIVAGGITMGCFVTMTWLLLYPGETRPNHPKYEILRHDR